MKNGVILAHKSTWRSRLDLDYLDETSGRKSAANERLGPVAGLGRKLRQFGDYASKESLGQVHCGGFFHDLVRLNPDGTSTAPSKLSNAQRKSRLSEAWSRHLRRFPTSSVAPVIQHRLVFSMSQPLHDGLVGAGLNPDRVLQSTMKKVIGKFADRFHADDSIGYAYGIHHDTEHLHVHVALCPRTAKGAYVGCSTSRTSRSGNRNQLDYLRKCFEEENKCWSRILETPGEVQRVVSRRLDGDRLTFSPKTHPLQLVAARNAQNHEAIRLTEFHRRIVDLERAIAARRQTTATARNVHFVGRLMGLRSSPASKVVSKARRAIDQHSTRQLQHLLFKMKRQYRDQHRRFLRLHVFQSYAHRLPNQQTATVRQQNSL